MQSNAEKDLETIKSLMIKVEESALIPSFSFYCWGLMISICSGLAFFLNQFTSMYFGQILTIYYGLLICLGCIFEGYGYYKQLKKLGIKVFSYSTKKLACSFILLIIPVILFGYILSNTHYYTLLYIYPLAVMGFGLAIYGLISSNNFFIGSFIMWVLFLIGFFFSMDAPLGYLLINLCGAFCMFYVGFSIRKVS